MSSKHFPIQAPDVSENVHDSFIDNVTKAQHRWVPEGSGQYFSLVSVVTVWVQQDLITELCIFSTTICQHVSAIWADKKLQTSQCQFVGELSLLTFHALHVPHHSSCSVSQLMMVCYRPHHLFAKDYSACPGSGKLFLFFHKKPPHLNSACHKHHNKYFPMPTNNQVERSLNSLLMGLSICMNLYCIDACFGSRFRSGFQNMSSLSFLAISLSETDKTVLIGAHTHCIASNNIVHTQQNLDSSTNLRISKWWQHLRRMPWPSTGQHYANQANWRQETKTSAIHW